MNTKQLLHLLILSINITLVLLIVCFVCLISGQLFDHFMVICTVILIFLFLLFAEFFLWIWKDGKERDKEHKALMMKCNEIKDTFTTLLFQEKIMKIYLKSFEWEEEAGEE